MAKKKRVVRKAVKPRQSWLGHKLAWLAAFFGGTIALLTAVTYRQMAGDYPPVLEAGTPTVIKEWEFDGGLEGWEGISKIPAYKNIEYIGTGTGGILNKDDDKASSNPINLIVSGGYLQFKQAGTGATIFNRSLNLDVSDADTLTVEVKMKATFSNALAKTAGPLAKHTATLELVGKTDSVSKSVTVTADSTGEAVYRFVFSQSELGAKRKVAGVAMGVQGLVKGIDFQPNVGNKAVILTNVKIDSITVMSE